ncbi:hypothetical protein HDF16_002144 [Granulicella aggregans]|uniref:Uncharacterized protein n=1 Tax=Granulicella aggregans TaxID=474949 RepID=A0A7W8E2Z0_9BACT|nr:hypothetical protein [Granulicella aggregans]MBB5057438.1 hypothetical protein [Granulicella aggregans]
MALPAAKLMANKAEETVAAKGGKKLLSWLTEKLSSSPVAKETLARAGADPGKPRKLLAVQNEIEGMAEDYHTFLEEPAKHIEATGVSLTNQSQTAIGDNNTTTNQVMGNNISIGL